MMTGLSFLLAVIAIVLLVIAIFLSPALRDRLVLGAVAALAVALLLDR